MCTADTDSEFCRGMSPPAPSTLDSKLKRVTRLRTLTENQCKMMIFENDKPAHVATVLKTFWALDCFHL